MIPEEEDDWTKDPEMQEFLEWVDKQGPWPEEYDKSYTVGGLSADKDRGFMEFQKKMKKRDEKKGE